MTTATKEKNAAPRRQPAVQRIIEGRPECQETFLGGVLVSKVKYNLKRHVVVNSPPGKVNKYKTRVLAERASKHLPRPTTPPKQDEISLLQETYRAFWAGRLPEDRIEEECLRIRSLFRA
jgi:hypothetical protein